jgi:hypothetical protein
MEKIVYTGWPNCYRLANGLVELVVTTDVGPRVIRFGFVGGANVFKEYDAMLGLTGGDEWRIYGGHRLWHAPEGNPRTYCPDNGPVQIEEHPGFVRLIQPTEKTTGIQKEIDVHLAPDRAHARLVHRLRNHNLWAVELAPWALSVTAPGGKVIIPLPPRGTHPQALLPANAFALWAYSDMADPRWTWGTKYIMLRQDPAASAPQKIGVMAPDGWIACANYGNLFVKKIACVSDAPYPDFGSTVETFTNADMLEVETLGPLVRLEPGAAVEHMEDWFLFAGVPMPQNDADVDRDVLPRVREAR